jgi:hypothetical protein
VLSAVPSSAQRTTPSKQHRIAESRYSRVTAVGPVGRDDPAPCRHSTNGDGAEPSRQSIDGHRLAPTATARSPPTTASTATDQRRRRRLRALPPQRRRPQINADGDGSAPSRHSVRVDSHKSTLTATARTLLSGDGDGAEPSRHSVDGHRSARTASSPHGRLMPQHRQRRC